MQINGFSAGVEPGGLYESSDIRLLLCYVLYHVGEPMPRDMLMDTLVGNGMSNFFETTEALEALLDAKSISQSEDPEKLLTIMPDRREAVETLCDHLPRTLRERSVAYAEKAMARRRTERESDIRITDLPHGCEISCTVRDAEAPLFSFSLKVADRTQAKLVKEQFLDNPDLVYRSLFAVLTGQADIREENGKPVIRLP